MFSVGSNATIEFIMALGGAAATCAVRRACAAGRCAALQDWIPRARVPRALHLTKAFEDGLRSLGYRVGENVVIEYRFANGEMERLPALAADLVRLGVDIIVTGNNPTVAAMKATTTIPIVMTNSADPVGAGLVASLARPGGNVTGFSRGRWRRDFRQAARIAEGNTAEPLACRRSVESGLCAQSEPADVDEGGRPGAGVDACPGRSTRAGRT